MKSKKKLLLMGVGVMGALAMGVGATSTFAWFQAESVTAALKSKGAEQMVTASPSTIALNLPVKFTITQDTSKTVALTDSTGATKAVNNGGLVDATINDATQARTGNFKISVAWVVAGDCDGTDENEGKINIGGSYFAPATDDQKLAAAGSYQGFEVSVGEHSNALLVENTNTTGANPTGTNEWKFMVVVKDDGDLELRVTDGALSVTTFITEANNRLTMGTDADSDKVIGKFAVRPNNVYGAEVASEAATGCQVAGTYNKAAAIAKGQAFVNDGHYYVAKDAYAANVTDALTNSTYFEEVYLHSNDKIVISDN